MEVNFCVFGGQGKTTGYDKWFQFLYFFKILNILFNLTEKDDCANLLNPRRTASHGGLRHHQHRRRIALAAPANSNATIYDEGYIGKR